MNKIDGIGRLISTVLEYYNIIFPLVIGLVGMFSGILGIKHKLLQISTHKSNQIYNLFMNSGEKYPNEEALYISVSNLLGRSCSMKDIRFAFARDNPILALKTILSVRNFVALDSSLKPVSIIRSRTSDYYKNKSNFLFIFITFMYFPTMATCILMQNTFTLVCIILIIVYVISSCFGFLYASRLNLAFQLIECDKFFPPSTRQQRIVLV